MKTQINSKPERMKLISFCLITLFLLLATHTQNSFAAPPADSIRAGENNINVRQSTAAVEFEGKILFYVQEG